MKEPAVGGLTATSNGGGVGAAAQSDQHISSIVCRETAGLRQEGGFGVIVAILCLDKVTGWSPSLFVISILS